MKEEINPQIRSEDVHAYLPSEIMLNIFLRIPTLTVIKCKCVCKAWRDLLDTHEFVQSHLSRSVPRLAVYLSSEKSKQYRIIEFEDEDRLKTVFSFDLPFLTYGGYIVHSSAKGLLFVCNRYENPHDVSFVFNPFTREYITIPSPLEASSQHPIYGFGVSKIRGEYKVVRISHDAVDCHVYTVGTGSWRRIEFHDLLRYPVGEFLNGNLHWLGNKKGSSGVELICCLDLETERFSTFSPPPAPGHYHCYTSLAVLRDYLCVCYTFYETWGGVGSIDVWLMKEYGDDKSWTKQFHFVSRYGINYYHPIKVFNDGDILMRLGSDTLIYCSKKNGRETFQKVALFKDDHRNSTTIYAPSFLSLKTFAMENVSSF